MAKFLFYEWKKLRKSAITGELLFYWILLFLLPSFFVLFQTKGNAFHFSEAFLYADLSVRVAMPLLAVTWIHRIFTDEYRTRTILSLYVSPFSRNKMAAIKVIFLFLLLFPAVFLSYMISMAGIFAIGEGFQTWGDIARPDWLFYMKYFFLHSPVIALCSLIPVLAILFRPSSRLFTGSLAAFVLFLLYLDSFFEYGESGLYMAPIGLLSTAVVILTIDRWNQL